MEIGKLFREFRVERNITLKEASNGIVTFSYLSKFERGLVKITVENLMLLLERLDISIIEFFTYLKKDEISDKTLLNEISNAFKNQDISSLFQLADNQYRLYTMTKNIKLKYNGIMIKAILSNIENIDISLEERILVSNYLINCSIWTNYEIILLGNSFNIFSEFFQKSIVIEIQKRITSIPLNDENRYNLKNVLINICIHYLNENRLIEVNDIVLFLEDILNNNEYFFKTRLLFIKSNIYILEGNTDEGIALANKSISIFEIFDPVFANMHKDKLSKLMAKI